MPYTYPYNYLRAPAQYNLLCACSENIYAASVYIDQIDVPLHFGHRIFSQLDQILQQQQHWTRACKEEDNNNNSEPYPATATLNQTVIPQSHAESKKLTQPNSNLAW